MKLNSMIQNSTIARKIMILILDGILFMPLGSHGISNPWELLKKLQDAQKKGSPSTPDRDKSTPPPSIDPTSNSDSSEDVFKTYKTPDSKESLNELRRPFKPESDVKEKDSLIEVYKPLKNINDDGESLLKVYQVHPTKKKGSDDENGRLDDYFHPPKVDSTELSQKFSPPLQIDESLLRSQNVNLPFVNINPNDNRAPSSTPPTPGAVEILSSPKVEPKKTELPTSG